MSTPISQLLKFKGSCPIYSIEKDVMVRDAVQVMSEHVVGSLLVMEGERLVGIFTERDVLYRVVANDLDPKTTPLVDVMTANLITITEKTTLEEVMGISSEKKIRHLPVFDENKSKLVGVISSGDATRWLAKINKIEAEHLMQIISDSYPG